MKFIGYAFFFFFLLLTNCSNPEVEYQKLRKEKLKRKNQLKALSRVSALPVTIKTPGDNLGSPSKIALGKLLFLILYFPEIRMYPVRPAITPIMVMLNLETFQLV